MPAEAEDKRGVELQASLIESYGRSTDGSTAVI